VRLINSLKAVEDYEKYSIGVLRFNNFTILAKLEFNDSNAVKDYLVKKANEDVIENYAAKKSTIMHLEELNISTEF
jgi:hypothetical protein